MSSSLLPVLLLFRPALPPHGGCLRLCDKGQLLSFLRQIEETRLNIDRIAEHVEEAKKLYSVILSAPIPEPSECPWPLPRPLAGLPGALHCPATHAFLFPAR